MEFLSIIVLIFSPLIAAGILFSPFFQRNEVRIRRFSKGFATLHFLYTILFLAAFNPLNEELSFYKNVTVNDLDWIHPLGIKFAFGVDGISILMVTLTSFIVLLALIASKNTIRQKHKFYYALVFLLQCAILGVFCARDMFLFFMFWELELIPMYFLIGQWGDAKAKESAMKFVLYTFFGSLFMLLGILLLHFYNFATYGLMSADFSSILVAAPEFPLPLQMLISVLFLVGFAVKLPIVPLHTWLPDAHVDAPTPISMILAAILLKMGAYGIIRFNMGMLPEAFKLLAPVLLILALINIVYTAFVAYSQTDLKKIVAYSSISNMGIVLLGLASITVMGLSGALFQMIAHGIISAGLFMLVGSVYYRTKTREIIELGGIGQVMPKLMAFGIILSMASVALPLLIGFVGEFLVLFGVFNSSLSDVAPVKLYTLIAAIVIVLSAAYVLRLLHKTFFGNMLEKWKNVKDVMNHEILIFTTLCAVTIFFGIFPMSILNFIEPVAADILHFLQL